MLTFNEVIQSAADDHAALEIRTEREDIKTIPILGNPFILYQGHRVIFSPKRASGTANADALLVWNSDSEMLRTTDQTDTQYYLRTNQFGVFRDAAGNGLEQIDTFDTWNFQTTEFPTVARPTLLRSFPEHDQTGVSDQVVIQLQFSELVVVDTTLEFTFTNCGLDQDCSTKDDNLEVRRPMSEFIDAPADCGAYSAAQGGAAAIIVNDALGAGNEFLADANWIRTDQGDPTNTLCPDDLFSFSGVNLRSDGVTAHYQGVPYGFIYFRTAGRGLLIANTKYMLTFPAGGAYSCRAADAGCPNDRALNEEFRFEFSTGAYQRFDYRYTFPVNTRASSSEGLVFDLSLNPDVTAVQDCPDGVCTGRHVFKYTVCYCDGQKDAAASDTTVEGGFVFDAQGGKVDPLTLALQQRNSTYRLQEAMRCSTLDSYISKDFLLPAYSMHACSDKCNMGCTGPSCFCDGNDLRGTTHYDADKTLCLSPVMCQEACNAHSLDNPNFIAFNQAGSQADRQICLGIDMHASKNACYLIGGLSDNPNAADPLAGYLETSVATWECYNNAALTVDEQFQHFKKLRGSTCTHASDYSEYAGMLTVTNRVQAGIDYILEPGSEVNQGGEMRSARNSIEVVHANGAELTYMDGALSRDRITIIDCKGTCGVSKPTAEVAVPANAGSIETWNLHWPLHHYIDHPHNDSENVFSGDLPQVVSYTERNYVNFDGYFCGQNNLDISGIHLSMDGVLQPLSTHQCFQKCAANQCVGDLCFCDGHFSGYDGPTSNALCLDATMARYFCDRLPDCEGFDMHAGANRVFLNAKSTDDATSCETNVALMTADANYNHFVAQSDVVDQGTENTDGPIYVENLYNRLVDDDVTSTRTELDWAFSWKQVLRFTGIQFNSGGKFKLCFCDSEHLRTSLPTEEFTGGACSTEKHYSVEIGTIHVSSVSCLLTDSKFQRVDCRSQYHGGLRCYRPPVEAPRLIPPRVQDDVRVSDLVATDAFQAAMGTWCLYGPEEVTQNDPRCQLVAAYQSVR